MRRSAWKWAGLGGLIAIILLYGTEMATSGIEKVYGPLDRGGGVYDAASLPVQQKTIAERRKELLDAERYYADNYGTGASIGEERAETAGGIERLPGLPVQGHIPSVNRVADGTAGLLQSVSSGSIRFVVSLFDAITN
jgi:hypothetical protein